MLIYNFNSNSQKENFLFMSISLVKNVESLQLTDNLTSKQNQPQSIQIQKKQPSIQNQNNSMESDVIVKNAQPIPDLNKQPLLQDFEKIPNESQLKDENIDQNNLLGDEGEKLKQAQNIIDEQEQIKKNYEQEDKIKELRCENKFCNSNENIKKIKSKVHDKYLNFCRRCYERYGSNAYCYYCQQIYLSQNDCDGLEWIQCQNCQRWNHTQCQKQNNSLRLTGRNDSYLCSDCQKKNKRKRHPIDSYQIYQYEKSKKKMIAKNKIQNPPQKYKIFRQKKDTYALLDSFLTAFSYKLALPQQQINRDLYLMRQSYDYEIGIKQKNDLNNMNTGVARKKKR